MLSDGDLHVPYDCSFNGLLNLLEKKLMVVAAMKIMC